MATSLPQKTVRQLSSPVGAPLLIVLGFVTSTAAQAQIAKFTVQ